VTPSPFLGLSHVDIPVTNLERSLAIYRDATGFPESDRGDGWVVIDGATAAIRLLATSKPEHRSTIRLQANDVEAAAKVLVDAGATTLYDPMRTPEQELVAAVRDPDGHTIYVWRALTEDEFDFVPDLPKEMTWDPEAEAFLKSLLEAVPALFRGLARRKVTREAELLAAETNCVTRQEVIRGFILSSPKITRGRNRQPLIDHGVDVDKYQADWDAD